MANKFILKTKHLNHPAKKLITDKLIPFCEVIFISEKNNDYKYLTATKIIESTIKYFIKLKQPNFDLRKREPLKNLIAQAIKEDKKIAEYISALFEYVDKRNNEAHDKPAITLTKSELTSLRKNLNEYLNWFFKDVLKSDFKTLIEEIKLKTSTECIHTTRKKSEHDRSEINFKLRESLDVLKGKRIAEDENILVQISDNDIFSRTYDTDKILNRNEMRGCSIDKPNSLDGLNVEVKFVRPHIQITNLSESVAVKIDSNSILKGRKKNIPIGKYLLTLNDNKFNLMIKTFKK